jgi:hypothetical protein
VLTNSSGVRDRGGIARMHEPKDTWLSYELCPWFEKKSSVASAAILSEQA